VNLTAIRERVVLDAIRFAPKALVSATIGWGARRRLPRSMRSPAYRAFARWAGARIDEAELPLHEYPSLAHFFARRLRPGLRPVAGTPGTLVAPCDGVVAAAGRVERGHMIQAKGMHYDLGRLVVDERIAAELEGGSYLTIYLSPRDYHRVHAPMQAKLLGYDHVPGSHFPVNPLFSRSVDGLMAQNERVVFHLRTEVGAACLVMVAALGVSNMEVACDRMETRHLRASGRDRKVRFDEPLELARGEELGAFHLGSTTIIIFEPGSVALDSFSVGDTVRFGQPIGRSADRAHRIEPVGTIG
jgi:phosphatidylserine decarboxylase